jgi:prepilin-type N-terminal cleavage/methylation domain-containing protein
VSARAGSRSGFTLVEILVATAVLLVVGGAAATLLMQAFALWEHGVARTRRLAATDAFLTRFARDFAAAAPGLGFTGDTVRCQFWTLEVFPERPPQLAAVDYAVVPGAIIRHAAGADTPPCETRYAPVEPAVFSYARPSDSGEPWEPGWANPTSAPARVQLQARTTAEDTFFPRALARSTP